MATLTQCPKCSGKGEYYFILPDDVGSPNLVKCDKCGGTGFIPIKRYGLPPNASQRRSLMYPLHRSDTGSFQELAHATNVEFGQLSLLTINMGCERGGHYHTRKREWFCCLHGIVVLSVFPIGSPDRKADIELKHGEMVAVEPMQVHTVRNICEGTCELLVISSEEYDPDDADTVKWEGNVHA